MSTTLGNLPFKRFVMQVSTGAPRIKSNWQAMMAENLEALKSPVWREAAVETASLVDHDFAAATHLKDGYDAFKMTGNYDATAMTEVGYAGMVAYRFKLPDDYVSGSANITAISVPVYRDRFCRAGVRLAAAFGGESPAAFGWDDARAGGGDVDAKTAMMAQSATDVPYLTASSAADETATFELSPLASKSTYLWLFLTLEDYTDAWEWYSKKEKRLYAIEGSARLAGDLLSVTFDADVTPDGAEHEMNVVRGGVVPKLPEGSASGARVLELFKTGDPIVPSFTDAATVPGYTCMQFGTRVTEFAGDAADVNVSIPFTLGGSTTRIVAVCGSFERASVPGVPGLVLIDAATGAIMQATVSGTIDSTAAALVNTSASKVGVSIRVIDDVPHAWIYAASATQFTFVPFIEIDLSTMVATPGVLGAGLSSYIMGFSDSSGGYVTSERSVAFYDVAILESMVLYTHQPSGSSMRGAPLMCEWTKETSEGSGEFVKVACLTPINSVGSIRGTAFSAYYACVFSIDGLGEIYGLSVAWDSSTSAASGDGSLFSVCVAGDFDGAYRYGDSGIGTQIISGAGGLARVDARFVSTSAGASSTSYPKDNATATRIDAGITPSSLDHVDQLGYGDSRYLVYGGFYAAAGSAALRYAFLFDAELGTRTSIGATAIPSKAFELGDGFGLVRPRVGSAQTDFYFSTDIPSEPSAANSAIGLRTLQGKFYLGAASAVERATRDRMGAAYSVRAGTRTLKVVTGGSAADTSVPVWRLFASALVLPFAVPTEWRARGLRLDWTDWAGTATSGARLNVWLRAGQWQDACPQVLESDIPYDALKAEADGWMLLGSVDATLSGAGRTALFDLAGRFGSAKVASLMLSAYAPTDGINPYANTAWPVGAATEVDVVSGDVVNAGKAWLPDITLVG